MKFEKPLAFAEHLRMTTACVEAIETVSHISYLYQGSSIFLPLSLDIKSLYNRIHN